MGSSSILALDPSELFFYIWEHSAPGKLRNVSTVDASITTIATHTALGFSQTGVSGLAVHPTTQELYVMRNQPAFGTTVAACGLYKLAPGGSTLIALTGTSCSSNDGVLSTSSSFFNAASRMAFSRDGSSLFLCENPLIRRIVMGSGTMTVGSFAGSSTAGYADGTGTSALFRTCLLHFDRYADQLFVADSSNFRVRRVDPSTAEVATVAGSQGSSGFADGAAVREAKLSALAGVGMMADGRLLILEATGSRVRQLLPYPWP